MFFTRKKKIRVCDKSDEALAEAHESVKNGVARGVEVSEAANALKELREQNHFARQLSEIMSPRVWKGL